MKKTILIIGMGPGLSLGIAEKFGSEGFQVGMISRSDEKLKEYQKYLEDRNVVSSFAVADVADTNQMLDAIEILKSRLGPVQVLSYNAVDFRIKNIWEETIEELTNGFKISVANALFACRALFEDLKQHSGALLLTGGSLAMTPNPDFGSISLGKAGIRSLASQLQQVLGPQGIYVGTMLINGFISRESTTHSPKILAQKFWDMQKARTQTEIIY